MISERNKSKAQIFLLLIVFVLFIMLANNIFKGFRFDLTENKLYTLGDGTLNIFNSLVSHKVQHIWEWNGSKFVKTAY